MLQQIIHYSIKNKVLVLLVTGAMAAAGIYSFTQIPIDAIPDITNNQVQVLTVSPTLATQEVEQFVTAPIELAVRSIPGVIELRSISRFGLSVVTVVFEEDIDMYLARQLLQEKLLEVRESIPPEFGTPEMAPISTGLGEILHYRIQAKPGFEDQYTPMDLREIQDWIVKKQLTGIPGVVEVNSFGGFLKQYEVAVKPERLRALNLSVLDVYEALALGNENSGGGYIEKGSNVYFIRSEGLVKSLSDIRRIVVRSPEDGSAGGSVLIGDVSEVRFGSALRYGAVSSNGKGEIVLGIVMMLKGENAADVIRKVKDRLSRIQPSLPEGVEITTFLDRENLVNRTIRTVRNNLFEGALIVIFVLVMLVGNLRAGLIIASVIPLSMLFALSMMHVFGVTANLMSLGAIDFGLIVDGAVIIVEATLFYLHSKWAGKTLSKSEMDASVQHAAGGIMRSSLFGILIILIVYLPILSLTGIEGKMFRPMAQTVSFALIGALLLSLTYVPAVSAWMIHRTVSDKQSFADKLIKRIESLYEPILKWAYKAKRTVILLTLLVFAGAILLFTRLGGEFIPTLDEGDIMLHGFLPPGSSLTQTLESHRLLQKKLLERFPDEIEQVISKIGSAEIPTDPMAIETADNIVLLKSKSEWTKASTKEELIEQMEEAVHEVPGMAFEFTQPIKMRFDEMMTGVRSDVAVKIFGENLDSLSIAGNRVELLIRNVEGVVDLKVEQVQGLPQIVIKFDYDQIARYGLHVRELNKAIQMAFAGSAASLVYEDERRFDLVVRLDTSVRQNVEDVRNLPVTVHNGSLIPLSAVANIDYRPGAAQISREEAQRRIVISANIRGRDVESAIFEIRSILEEKLRLPSGYYFSLGGQFENLEAARERLSIAVPIALILIFIMLFFAFNSVREGLLIFSAIPMSAVGGIIALWLRDMPFSISAGVGFIALFGVAVLNGIVLISYYKQLEKEGYDKLYERVRHGALVRLRPVLMTASVAALGFLPMALSHGAGAEVQRPLATVVIGGLITATLLTLIVLPVLYSMVFKMRAGKATAVVLLLLAAHGLQAQTRLTEQEAIDLALKNHPAMKAADKQIQREESMLDAARNWQPTSIYHNVSADPELGLFGTNALGFNQNFPNRKRTRANQNVYKKQVIQAQSAREVSASRLVKEVRELYQHLSYLDQLQSVYTRLDSFHREAFRISQLRVAAGDAPDVAMQLARAKSEAIRLELATINHEREFDQQILGQLLGLGTPVVACCCAPRTIFLLTGRHQQDPNRANCPVLQRWHTVSQCKKGPEGSRSGSRFWWRLQHPVPGRRTDIPGVSGGHQCAAYP